MVERSHRTDDEEFYIPFLGKVQTEDGFLRKAVSWVYYYNLERPHFGKGMNGKPPFRKLRELGYNLPEEFALFPPLVLDRISANWALWWSSRGGNDLLAHYKHVSPLGFLLRPVFRARARGGAARRTPSGLFTRDVRGGR